MIQGLSLKSVSIILKWVRHFARVSCSHAAAVDTWKNLLSQEYYTSAVILLIKPPHRLVSQLHVLRIFAAVVAHS